MKKRIAILISGGGSNMVQLLDSLTADHPGRAVLVVSNVPGAGGLQKAEARGVATAVLDHRPFAGDRAAFELAEELKGHHHHLVCVQCGLVLDIDVPNEVEQMLDTGVADLVSRAGFVLVGHRLDLMGRCENCA